MIFFHNPKHTQHLGWIDSTGKSWDVPERLVRVIETAKNGLKDTKWIAIQKPGKKTRGLLAKIHSPKMIQAIQLASAKATVSSPIKTEFDKGSHTNSTAIYPGTFEQALASAECAVAAAEALLSNDTDLAITVSRPPGHHAGRSFYHGFCYFNLAGIAAQAMLNSNKRVAILDFDIHHGDGTQDIFNSQPNVLYVSLHADPNKVMPGTGRAEDKGKLGNMVNFPLPIGVDWPSYEVLFNKALEHIKAFDPDYLIIEAGFDGHKDEFPLLPPITMLGNSEYKEIGKKIGQLKLPSLVIFGGGYNQKITADAFSGYLQGMVSGGGQNV